MQKRMILMFTAVVIIAAGCLGRAPLPSQPDVQSTPALTTTPPARTWPWRLGRQDTKKSTGTVTPTSTPTWEPTPSQAPTNATSTPTREPTPTPEPTSTQEPTPDQLNATEATTPTNLAPNLVHIIWQWTKLREPKGQSAIAAPQNYVLVFDAEGTVNVKADCNVGHSSYALEGSHISLEPIALTRALCPKGSRSTQFATLLGNADAIEVDTETHKLIITLKDQAGEMVFDEAGKAKVPPAPCDWTLDDLWVWEHFEDRAGKNNIAVDDSSKYTLRLEPSGTFQFKADCNVGSGMYTWDCEGNITFQLGPATIAECGADSLYDEYLDALGDVVSLVMVEGKMLLNLKNDAGYLAFGQ